MAVSMNMDMADRDSLSAVCVLWFVSGATAWPSLVSRESL